MSHSHHSEKSKAFAIGVSINLIYVVVQIIYGLMVNSLALLADAGHNLSDVLGLFLAWGAGFLMKKGANRRRTYGFMKTSILAAFLNAVILLLAVGAIVFEAVRRFAQPEIIDSGVVIKVAAVGFIINGASALLFVRGRNEDLNIKGAFLHMASDAAVSLGVIAGAVIISFTSWYMVDPILSLIIAAAIVVSTWDLLRDSFNLTLDAVPREIKLHEVESYLKGLPGVKEIHDLHVWGMSTTDTALTVHIVNPEVMTDDNFISGICRTLSEQYGIKHVTIQVEKDITTEYCTKSHV